jgi:putative acetyltransferase
MVLIREERPEDISNVRRVNEQAFGRPVEARIIDNLRKSGAELLGLVAEWDRKIVGHILFSPVTIEGEKGEIRGMGLAPMAVPPDYQGREIGSRLVKQGLILLRNRGCPFVIVLGHPGYYPRFGFERASRFGVKSQWEGVPDEAFMMLILDESLRGGLGGTARYRKEFDEAMETCAFV